MPVRTCNEIDQRLRRSFRGFERTLSLIHAEAQQKREEGDREDRAEGRIESLIQGRVRSRSYDLSW